MSTGETFTSPPPLVERCEVADVPFAALSDIPPPNALISLERVRGAGSLLLSYRYGDQLRFFDAVDAARTLLDTDRLCLDGTGDQALLNRLYCWPELESGVPGERYHPPQPGGQGVRDPESGRG